MTMSLSLLRLSLMVIAVSLSSSSVAAAALSSQSIMTAAEVLRDSGGTVSMGLTLGMVADTVSSLSPTITVFSPSDQAFSDSGQPSLSLLNLHMSPLSLSPSTLRSLPYGTKIPTMSSGESLTVTSLPSSPLSLNNVTIADSPTYDDASLIVYQIPQFFNPNFTIPTTTTTTKPTPVPSPNCPHNTSSSSTFHYASQILISRGYSITASFLSLQLIGSAQNPPKMTVFAPIDDVIVHSIKGNFSEYASLLLRHVAPCAVRYKDLTSLENGAVLGTYSDGFSIRVSETNGLVMVNEIPVTFPDLYSSDWLIVHGLHEVFEPEAGVAAPPQEVGRETEF